MNNEYLQTPYISQWATQASNRGNDCGQTCVAMLAWLRGVYKPVNAYIYQSDSTGLSTADDLVANLTGIAHLSASSKTLPPNTLTPPGSICLVQYSIFPVGTGEYEKQDDFSGLHWFIVLNEVPGEYVETNDPDYYGERIAEGENKRYRWADWLKEISQQRTVVSLD